MLFVYFNLFIVYSSSFMLFIMLASLTSLLWLYNDVKFRLLSKHLSRFLSCLLTILACLLACLLVYLLTYLLTYWLPSLLTYSYLLYHFHHLHPTKKFQNFPKKKKKKISSLSLSFDCLPLMIYFR